jgi:hypothetical protein
LSYRHARLHSLEELVPWNRFLGTIKLLQIRAQAAKVAGINSLESIPGLIKSLKVPSLPLYIQLGIDREANIRGGGKTVHVVVLLGTESSLARKGAA